MSWEENVRKVVPYVAGEQPKKTGVIKLNTNECPYPPTPGVVKLAAEMDCDALRLYPDTNAAPLTAALADYYHVNQNQIFVGVGSDDVLSMAFMTFFNSGKPIFPMEDFENFCRDHHVKIGILTVPSTQAQEVCDRMVKAGICALWCFAPCTLRTPENVLVQYENMALSLAFLNKKFKG